MTSFLISGHLLCQKWGFSITYVFLNELSSHLTRIQNSMLILIVGPKSGLGGWFWKIWHKNHYLTSLFGQTPLRSSIAMATPKVPCDQKLFERVSYTLILKVTKFQLSTPNSFLAVLKNSSGGGGEFPSPIQNRVNFIMLHDCPATENETGNLNPETMKRNLKPTLHSLLHIRPL